MTSNRLLATTEYRVDINPTITVESLVTQDRVPSNRVMAMSIDCHVERTHVICGDIGNYAHKQSDLRPSRLHGLEGVPTYSSMSSPVSRRLSMRRPC
jgi:hypothetical protein